MTHRYNFETGLRISSNFAHFPEKLPFSSSHQSEICIKTRRNYSYTDHHILDSTSRCQFSSLCNLCYRHLSIVTSRQFLGDEPHLLTPLHKGLRSLCDGQTISFGEEKIW